MRTIHIFGEPIIVINSRRIDSVCFERACDCIGRIGKSILNVKKESVLILQDEELNTIVIERMHTDTFTLQVKYEIKSQNVFQIS